VDDEEDESGCSSFSPSSVIEVMNRLLMVFAKQEVFAGGDRKRQHPSVVLYTIAPQSLRHLDGFHVRTVQSCTASLTVQVENNGTLVVSKLFSLWTEPHLIGLTSTASHA
jgi:hypothetical protein